MLSVIASIISSALGLVLNKARTTATDKLKDGDITHEKLRDVINDDLNDIKSKIDGLSRKDLLASYSFLKEGVVSLNLALDEPKDEQTSKDDTNGDQNGGSQTTAATTRNESESGVLNVIALSQAIQKLNDKSKDRLVSTEKYFTTAREEATRAFWNEALSLPDRIMAAKLRVVSKILECLQDTKAAAAGCMLFLEELHNLPAIGETFSTYFKGGMKSKVYKDSRLENVKSVLSLNFAISEFVARFSGELPNVRNWPRIHLSTKETIHPLCLDMRVVTKIFGKEEYKPPENQVNINNDHHDFRRFKDCINSKGQLLSPNQFDDRIDILNTSEDIKTFCHIRQATANVEGINEHSVVALAIDRHDNLFVIICTKGGHRTGGKYVLFVFDSSGNKQNERALDFFGGHNEWIINCVVNNDGVIIIKQLFGRYIYVCDSNGNLKSRLPLEENSNYHSGDYISLQCVTDQNEIILKTRTHVLVYTKEWKIKRAIKVGYGMFSVTYNDATSKIEILMRKELYFGRGYYCILSYSQDGEIERLYLPENTRTEYAGFCSHPAGTAAFVYQSCSETKQSKIIFM